MKKYTILAAGAMAVFVSGTAQAADVTGFRSARFGMNEKAVIDSAIADLGVKAADIQRAQDPTIKVTTLAVKQKAFAPLNLPATVTYVLGYKCDCLTQVSVMWDFPDNISIDQRKSAMIGVGALVNRFVSLGWGKEETVSNRVVGEIKEGSDNTIVFFRGQNKNNSAISVAGSPVKMTKDPKETKKEDPLAANIDGIKNVSVSYEKDSVNPDIYRVDVTGF